jgi:restriction system protein
METIEKRYYLVRTEREFVNRERIAIGWSWIDFTQYDNANEIIAKIGKHIGRSANQIKRFVGVKQGDIVIVPLYKSVAIGIATDTKLYSSEDERKDRSNQIAVEFFKRDNKPIIIPRDIFSEKFQRRLRVQGMTVNSLDEFKDEIEKIISGLNSGEIVSWNDRVIEETEKLANTFKANLLKNIQHGKINLQAGGVGLENLVKELLEIDGYTARVLGKRDFKSFADADVVASKSDSILETKLLIQVKHHRGIANNWGIQQLREIRNQDKGEYSEHHLVLVTSAFANDSFVNDAKDENIIVVDGNKLVDWIFDSLGELSDKTKTQLGICEVPQIAFID